MASSHISWLSLTDELRSTTAGCRTWMLNYCNLVIRGYADLRSPYPYVLHIYCNCGHFYLLAQLTLSVTLQEHFLAVVMVIKFELHELRLIV